MLCVLNNYISNTDTKNFGNNLNELQIQKSRPNSVNIPNGIFVGKKIQISLVYIQMIVLICTLVILIFCHVHMLP